MLESVDEDYRTWPTRPFRDITVTYVPFGVLIVFLGSIQASVAVGWSWNARKDGGCQGCWAPLAVRPSLP